MKKKIFYILAIAIVAISYGFHRFDFTNDKKEFEGEITYQISIKSKTSNISTKQLQDVYGSIMVMTFKDGNYKMSYKGHDIKNIYYINKANNQYALRKGIDTLFVTSCKDANSQLMSSKFLTGTEIIMNHKCKMLVNDLGETKNYYWFDQTLYIDPKHYEKHKFGFANVYYSKAQSPYLKYKFEGKSFDITYTAVKITQETVNFNAFILPKLPITELR